MSSWRKTFSLLWQKFTRKLHLSKVRQEAEIIDGTKIAEEIQEELKVVIETCINAGMKRPKLVVILVGNHPSSKDEFDTKMKAANSIGIDSYAIHLGENITQAELLKKIDNLNRDSSVDGIVVQLPLPESMNEREVCQAILPKKDVDGFYSKALESWDVTSDENSIKPATALAVRELILRSKIEAFGKKHTVVMLRRKYIQLSVIMSFRATVKELIQLGETGEMGIHAIFSRNTNHIVAKEWAKAKLADLVIVAVGHPGFVTKEVIKPGACVIDVGITRVKTADGKYRLVGDVDHDSVKKVAGHITTVPGGVDSVTVAMLMKNTITAAIKNQKDTEQPDHLENSEAFVY